MTRFLAPALLLLSLNLAAQVVMPATSVADMHALSELAGRTNDARKLVAAAQGDFPVALINGRCMVGFLGKVANAFDAGAVGPAVRIGARVGDVLSFRVDAYDLEAVHGISGLLYAEMAGLARPDLDRVVRATRVDSVVHGINLPQSYTGRDVLIGIMDWGFDYTHPMFYDTALTTSRVRAAWDMWRQAGPAPAAYGYGTELTTPAALMTAEADTANVYSYATHGSHVAGIAGGSGAGTNYRGMAFDAQFLFCTMLVDAAAVIDGYAWMKSVADLDQKRLVVNNSWGLYYMGTLDGNSLISQAIDQLSAEGVVFCNSGGNNGDVNFHLRRDFNGDTLRSRVEFYPYSAHPKMWGQSLTMWGEEAQSFKAGFRVVDNLNVVAAETPWYGTATQAAYLDSMLIIGTDTVFFNLTTDAAHPLNGRPHMRLRVKNTSVFWRIVLQVTAADGRVHCWNVTELSNDVGNWGMAFQGGSGGLVNGDHNYGISEPACTESLITVAAYSAEFFLSNGAEVGGAIAGFSSFGPTMDERMKPDITAPGLGVVSSISSFTDNNYTPVLIVPFQGRDYPFASFSGTSMSSPALTGIVALILEADPTLTAAEVKDLIKATARTDAQTGVIPTAGSTRWGKGKVNAYRAVCEALGVVAVPEASDDGLLVWPVPTTDQVHVMLPSSGMAQITVLDVAGRCVVQEMVSNGNAVLSTGSWAPGVYGLRVAQGGSSSFARVVKQ
ncbi:MAG: S8 family peptidase [Flavobacteriales bacterium]|nr:S8 family peptidase [Flavobacteriales bacterium]